MDGSLMAWLRIDDGMMEHPKILGLSDREFRVHMNALCYTGRRRDPHVPTQALPILQGTRKHANRLEDVGLWDRNGDGWVIHDWEDYQSAKTGAERQSAWRRKHGSNSDDT